jgi:hypothetical protein
MATESDNVNSGMLMTLIVVLTTAMLGISLVVTALVRSEVNEEHDKKDVAVDRPLRDLIAEQRAKMNAPAAYLDRGKGTVSLPIERAMELVVSDLKRDPNTATPPGAASAAPASSGEAAPAPATATGGETKPVDEATHAEPGKPDDKAATDLTSSGEKSTKTEKTDAKKEKAAKPETAKAPKAEKPGAPPPNPAAPSPAPPTAPANGQ